MRIGSLYVNFAFFINKPKTELKLTLREMTRKVTILKLKTISLSEFEPGVEIEDIIEYALENLENAKDIIEPGDTLEANWKELLFEYIQMNI